MSGSFDILDQPVQIYLGDQSTVSLVNDGPFTAYFDENPSVDSINGFELPPTGQMAWRGSKPLWARCRAFTPNIGPVPAGGFQPKARVRTALSGELSLTTRAKFYRELYTGPPFPTGGNPFMEVGHCNTLLVTFSLSAADATALPISTITVAWYDDSLTLISYDTWYQFFSTTDIPNGASIPTWRLSIPVKGRFCVIAGNFDLPSMTMRVVGTDAILPARSDAGAFLGAGFVGAVAYIGHALTVTGWTAGVLNIPSNGYQVQLCFLNTGANSNVIINDAATARRLDTEGITAGASLTISLLAAVNSQLALSGSPAGYNFAVEITWPNATVTS